MAFYNKKAWEKYQEWLSKNPRCGNDKRESEEQEKKQEINKK